MSNLCCVCFTVNAATVVLFPGIACFGRFLVIPVVAFQFVYLYIVFFPDSVRIFTLQDRSDRGPKLTVYLVVYLAEVHHGSLVKDSYLAYCDCLLICTSEIFLRFDSS